MLNFHPAAADAAEDMVMIFARDLISEMSIAGMGWTHQSILRQEF